MMKKLPSNFNLDKYNLQVRFVQEEDAEFITKLRTDARLSRFIHQTDNDIEVQKKWIRSYKEREALGTDYYFMYLQNDERLGVNRLYDITENEFTGGSFVFKPKCPIECPIFATLISFDIAFNLLDKKVANGDIRLGNKKVIKFHKLLNVEFTTQDELNQYYVYSRDTFNKQVSIIERMLGVI